MTKMRIGWATPFNTRSAIGTFSKVVCDELTRRSYELEVIRIESGEELGFDVIGCDYPVVNAAYSDVASYDLLIINFGNHAPYHAHALSLLSQRSPLAIFHDAEMRDFAWGLTHRHGKSVPLLSGVDDDDFQGGENLVHPEAAPLLSTIASMSCAAVVHGPHYLDTVSTNCPGPVQVVPLCFPDVGARPKGKRAKVAKRVTTFGVITEHKQPRRVMRAVAQLATGRGEPIEVHFAGSIEEHFRDDLIKEARELGIDPPVFHGFLPDDQLQELLENSQVICVLRYPVTEGGSASLITALYRGRPLIVSDVASYSMIPDKYITKVSYGDDPDDLAMALAGIFANPKASEKKALNAREWASDKFSAASYADALEPLFELAIRRSILTDLSRELSSAVQAPSSEPMLQAVKSFGNVLDWMQSAQE